MKLKFCLHIILMAVALLIVAGATQAQYSPGGTVIFRSVWPDTTGVPDVIYYVDQDGHIIVVFQDSTGQAMMQSGVGGSLGILVDSVNTVALRFPGSTSGSFSMLAAAVAGNPSPLIMPTTDGSPGWQWTTDGFGNTYWAAAGAGGGEANTASTSGPTFSIVEPKAGVNIPFKSFTGGDAISLDSSSNPNELIFDFDGGAIPAGDLGGTWASPTVDDNSHNHLITNISPFTVVEFETQLFDATSVFTNLVTGDVTLAAGVSAISPDVIGPPEMADADHGDVSWSLGVATVEGGFSDSTGKIDTTYSAFQAYVAAHAGTGFSFFSEADVGDSSELAPVGPNTVIALDAPVSMKGNPLTGVSSVTTEGDSSGFIDFSGRTSGLGGFGVQDVAGTPSRILLPTTDGSPGWQWTTDGFGNTSWAAAGAGGGEANTASTSGLTFSIVEPKAGVDLPFKSFTGGDAISLDSSSSPNELIFDFDGGAAPAGDLGGTWAAPTVNDDSHNHILTNIDAFTQAALEIQISNATSVFTNNATGDVTLAAGVSALSIDVVGPPEMADADHGDVSWSLGVASVEGGFSDSTGKIDTTYSAFQAYVAAHAGTGFTLLDETDVTDTSVLGPVGPNTWVGIGSDLTIGGNNLDGVNEIRFPGATSGSFSFGVAAVAGTPAKWIFPTTNGSAGWQLTTDGAGNTSWAAAGAGGGEANTASTSGLTFSIVEPKAGVDLPFKSFTGGDAISLDSSSSPNELIFDFDGGAAPAGDLGGTWASPTVDAAIYVDSAGSQYRMVYNTSGVAMTIGQAVYQSGYSAGQSLPIVSLADSDSPATMPAMGLIASASIPNNDSGRVITSGLLIGINTAGKTVKDPLYVSGTPGDLTEIRPTGVGAEIQIVARVEQVAASGEAGVSGAGRSNDVPNLQDGYFWVGNASNMFVAVQMSVDATMTNTGVITVTDDSHNHILSNIDAFTLADLQTQTSNVTDYFTDLATGDVTIAAGVSTIGTNTVDSNNVVANSLSLSGDVQAFSSDDLLTRLTDETGTGLAVFATSPTFLGTPTIPGIILYSSGSWRLVDATGPDTTLKVTDDNLGNVTLSTGTDQSTLTIGEPGMAQADSLTIGDTLVVNGDRFGDLTGDDLALALGALVLEDAIDVDSIHAALGDIDTVETGGNKIVEFAGPGLNVTGNALQADIDTIMYHVPVADPSNLNNDTLVLMQFDASGWNDSLIITALALYNRQATTDSAWLEIWTDLDHTVGTETPLDTLGKTTSRLVAAASFNARGPAVGEYLVLIVKLASASATQWNVRITGWKKQ